MKEEKQKRRLVHTVLSILAVLTLAVGLILLFGPLFLRKNHQEKLQKKIAGYEQLVEQLSGENRQEKLWQKAYLYNQTIKEKGSVLSLSAENLTWLRENLLCQLSEDMLGVLEIPAINLKLPVYFGTDANVLSFAAGMLSGSHLPVGGPGTHCVLSAHSGQVGATLFSDIHKLIVGDTAILHVLGHDLSYRCTGQTVVLPSEAECLSPVKEKDLLTLVTCTPIGVNSHRLLVSFERVASEREEEPSFPGGELVAEIPEINTLNGDKGTEQESKYVQNGGEEQLTGDGTEPFETNTPPAVKETEEETTKEPRTEEKKTTVESPDTEKAEEKQNEPSIESPISIPSEIIPENLKEAQTEIETTQAVSKKEPDTDPPTRAVSEYVTEAATETVTETYGLPETLYGLSLSQALPGQELVSLSPLSVSLLSPCVPRGSVFLPEKFTLSLTFPATGVKHPSFDFVSDTVTYSASLDTISELLIVSLPDLSQVGKAPLTLSVAGMVFETSFTVTPSYRDLCREALERLNAERTSRGLFPLAWSEELYKMACLRSEETLRTGVNHETELTLFTNECVCASQATDITIINGYEVMFFDEEHFNSLMNPSLSFAGISVGGFDFYNGLYYGNCCFLTTEADPLKVSGYGMSGNGVWGEMTGYTNEKTSVSLMAYIQKYDPLFFRQPSAYGL